MQDVWWGTGNTGKSDGRCLRVLRNQTDIAKTNDENRSPSCLVGFLVLQNSFIEETECNGFIKVQNVWWRYHIE